MLENESLFYNYSDEDFTWKRDGKEYTFKAGSVTPMTKGEFNHFSKHLIDRELLKEHKLTNNVDARVEHLKKCTGVLPSETVSFPSIPSVQFDGSTVVPKKFCEFCVSKGVRHMKDCTRPQVEEKPFAEA